MASNVQVNTNTNNTAAYNSCRKTAIVTGSIEGVSLGLATLGGVSALGSPAVGVPVAFGTSIYLGSQFIKAKTADCKKLYPDVARQLDTGR